MEDWASSWRRGWWRGAISPFLLSDYGFNYGGMCLTVCVVVAQDPRAFYVDETKSGCGKPQLQAGLRAALIRGKVSAPAWGEKDMNGVPCWHPEAKNYYPLVQDPRGFYGPVDPNFGKIITTPDHQRLNNQCVGWCLLHTCARRGSAFTALVLTVLMYVSVDTYTKWLQLASFARVAMGKTSRALFSTLCAERCGSIWAVYVSGLSSSRWCRRFAQS